MNELRNKCPYEVMKHQACTNNWYDLCLQTSPYLFYGQTLSAPPRDCPLSRSLQFNACRTTLDPRLESRVAPLSLARYLNLDLAGAMEKEDMLAAVSPF